MLTALPRLRTRAWGSPQSGGGPRGIAVHRCCGRPQGRALLAACGQVPGTSEAPGSLRGASWGFGCCKPLPAREDRANILVTAIIPASEGLGEMYICLTLAGGEFPRKRKRLF